MHLSAIYHQSCPQLVGFLAELVGWWSGKKHQPDHRKSLPARGGCAALVGLVGFSTAHILTYTRIHASDPYSHTRHSLSDSAGSVARIYTWKKTRPTRPDST